MLLRTLQLFVVLMGVTFSVAVPAEDWSVQSAQRDAKVLKRYRQLLLKNPDHAIAYRSLLGKLGRGPSLDPLIDDVRRVAAAGQQAEPYILLGHLERDRGRASASLAAYQKAVSLEPNNASTHAALGTALDRAGHRTAADASFERALGLTTTTNGRIKLLRKLSDSSIARSDFAGAVRWMEAIVELRPADYGLRVELGEMQLRAQQFDRALQTFQAAYQRAGRGGKRRAQTLIDIGNVHRRLHDHVAAEQAYRRALRLIGKGSWMRREVLMRLLDTSRESGGLAEMYGELRREWSSPSYHDAMVLAGVAEELGFADETVRWLERAMRLDRRAIEPRTRLIARLDHEKDAARVKRLYQEIVALRPDDLAQRLERIEWLFLRAGRAKEAMKALTQLEQELAARPDALVDIANTYVAFGLPDAALRIHEDLQQSSPDHLPHLEAYGELLTRLGRTEDAQKVWKHLFSVDTDEVGARLRVAEIAARQKNYDRAIELMRWVVDKYPRLVNARQRLAGVYETTKRWPEALAEWETLFFEYGVDHARRRVISIAQRTAFLGEQLLSPDDGMLARWEARYAEDRSIRTAAVLVQLRSIVNDDSGARTLAAELVARDPTQAPVRDRAAWLEVAHFIVKNEASPRAAIALLERIANAFGDQRASSWREAVDIAVRTNTDVDAVLSRALEAAPNDPYLHATAGVVRADRGDEQDAVEHMRRAIALGTKSFDTHFDLALLLKQQNRADEAREVYLTIIRTDRSGDYARSAVFSAIDTCSDDRQRRALIVELDGLRGRLDPQDFYAVAVAIYNELFLYADDPAALFESLGRQALPHLVASVQAREFSDQQHALRLLKLYPPELVVSAALRAWPRDAATWTEEMVRVLALGTSRDAQRAVVKAFQSEHAESREMAMFVAGVLRLHAATPKLLEVVQGASRPTPDVLVAAAALGRIGSEKSLAALTKMAAAPNAELRSLAVWALAQGEHPRSAALVADHLQPQTTTGELAGTVLNKSGDHGLRELLRVTWGEDPNLRAVARGGLRAVDYFDPWSAFPDELDQLYARPSQTIASAVESAQSPAVGAVAESFVGREKVVVEVTLAHLNNSAPMVLGDLLDAAEEVEDSGLEELAPSMKTVVRGLRPALRRLVRTAPAETLAPAVMLLPLAEHRQDVDLIAAAAGRLPQDQAARALERLSRYPWKSTRQALLQSMRAPEVLQRAAAVRAMARSADAGADAEVTELILALAHDEAPEVQVAAVDALGQLRHADSVDMLSELYDRSKPIVQKAIRRTLRRLPGDAARRASRKFEVRATVPVCAGDPDDLSDLLRDDCAGAVQISDF